MGVKNPTACYRELARVRKKTGLSGDQIASKAGWSRTHVWRMEIGHINSRIIRLIDLP